MYHPTDWPDTDKPNALAAVPNDSAKLVTANNTGGGLQMGSARLGWGEVSHWWQPLPQPTLNYATFTYPPPSLNPTEKAFRIVSAMMEKGMVGDLSVKEFVALVNDVAEIVRKN